MSPIPVLNYHRCHSRHCEGGHAPTTFTSEPEERRKGWKRCKCPIVASGTLGRVAKRKATKQTDWATAATVMAPFLAADSWDLTNSATPPQTPTPTPTPGPTSAPGRVHVEEATKAYVKAHEEANSAEMTIVGHRLRMATITQFAARTGAIFLDQWTPDIVRQYLSEFRVAATTAAKYHNVIKAFFAYCKSREWVTENPAKLPTVIKNRASKIEKAGKQRLPFTDADLERMYAACPQYEFLVAKRDGKIVPGKYPAFNRDWVGEDLADFIAISVYTGLRISNVATFNADRLKDEDEVHIRTIKGGGMVYTAVPSWLADRIRIRASKFGPMIFGEHTTSRLDVITNGWRKRLNALWKQCGKWDVHPTPHRFRHTFARVLLQSGHSPAVVAELLGDTEAVVRRHYAAWVPERQERISKMLRESFANVPTPFSQPRRAKVLPIMKHG